MNISYAITVKDEVDEIQSLLSKLGRYLSEVNYEYEIVILQDGANAECMYLITSLAKLPGSKYKHFTRNFDGDFAAHKNFLNSQCTGDFIFQIDADEYPSSILIDQTANLIEQNPLVDLFWLPRVNTVEGLTPEHTVKWGWRVQELEGVEGQVVNWPDYQGRLYRNDSSIQWVGKVHEHIAGAVRKLTYMPQETIWALFHHKTVERQEKQNALYATIQR